MDIDSSYLTNLSSQAVSEANASKLKSTLSNISETGSRVKAKGSGVNSAEEEKLLDACKQFESYFVEQMFKEMMKTVPKDALDTGSNSMLVDYYKDNLVKEYAAEATEKESLGLAQMLYEQMKRNIGITPEEADAKAAAAAGSGKKDGDDRNTSGAADPEESTVI
ncbi:MAG: rod-binding protein [Lachnospiraceae bacterium]|nr:rod-binding protein [Lachnospiraceae bacterium]MBQ4242927.1 rod-binding protein [Lachnospiraceae bacterium]